MGIGNKPIDGGNYLFTDTEKAEFLLAEPQALPWFRMWLGIDEFINGWHRWVLWLGECPPDVLRSMPKCLQRVVGGTCIPPCQQKCPHPENCRNPYPLPCREYTFGELSRSSRSKFRKKKIYTHRLYDTRCSVQ